VEQNSKAIALEDKFSIYCSMGILIPRSVPTMHFIWKFLKSVIYKHLQCTDEVEMGIVKAISANDNDMLGIVMNSIPIHCRKCIKHEGKYLE
jgi:metal-sulfur cluster biosynthetic enzyme